MTVVARWSNCSRLPRFPKHFPEMRTRTIMSDAEEVREIATKLVTDWLGAGSATTSSINAFGSAIVELAEQFDTVEEIRAVGRLLESLTEQDRGKIARGEWGKRSRTLSQEEAREMLLGLTLQEAEIFANRCGRAMVMNWVIGTEIPKEALVVLSNIESCPLSNV